MNFTYTLPELATNSTNGTLPEVVMNTTRILPELVIFTIEHILISANFGKDIVWPCSKQNENIVDLTGKIITYHPDVPAIFHKLENNSIKMAVIYSFNETEGANQLINFFDWDKYFSFKEISFTMDKLEPIRNIHTKSNISYHKMIYYDFDHTIVVIAEKTLDVYGDYIKDTQGIKLKYLEDSLMFYDGKEKWRVQYEEKKNEEKKIEEKKKGTKKRGRKKKKETAKDEGNKEEGKDERNKEAVKDEKNEDEGKDERKEEEGKDEKNEDEGKDERNEEEGKNEINKEKGKDIENKEEEKTEESRR